MPPTELKDPESEIKRVLGKEPDNSYMMEDNRSLTGLTLYACILNNCILVNCKLYKCILGGCKLKNCKQIACKNSTDDIPTLASGKSTAQWMLAGTTMTIEY
jgi:hypothetical protein